MDVFKIDFSYDGKIPERMIGGIRRYVMFGISPGSFLRAVMENDLMAAVATADDENSKLLRVYARFAYNELPTGAHGRRSKVTEWCELGGICGGAHLPQVETTRKKNGAWSKVTQEERGRWVKEFQEFNSQEIERLRRLG